MEENKPKRKRGRPRKVVDTNQDIANGRLPGIPKRKRRGRPTKEESLELERLKKEHLRQEALLSKNVNLTRVSGDNILHVSETLNVNKTYKLYIGGNFPRTESGRYLQLKTKEGKLIANYCRGSRKDFRNAVVVARKAFGSWSGRSAFNRSQIIYQVHLL